MSLIAVGLPHGQFDHGVLDLFQRCATFGDIKPWQSAAVGQDLAAVGGRGSLKDRASARFANGEGQIQRPQQRLLFENHAPLDRVLQFTNIAWPVMTENQPSCLVAEAKNRLLESAVV